MNGVVLSYTHILPPHYKLHLQSCSHSSWTFHHLIKLSSDIALWIQLIRHALYLEHVSVFLPLCWTCSLSPVVSGWIRGSGRRRTWGRRGREESPAGATWHYGEYSVCPSSTSQPSHHVYNWLVIDRYWCFITDTDYLYVYVPDNRYSELIFIHCYKVHKEQSEVHSSLSVVLTTTNNCWKLTFSCQI